MAVDSLEYLETIGSLSDSEIDPAPVALCLAHYACPDRSLDRYFNHLKKLSERTGERFQELIKAGAADDAGTRLAAIKHILIDEEGYQGDRETYDDLQNADLIAVIDRRKGLPIALAILVIHMGRAQGWSVDALNFPGHVVCRLDDGGERLVFDPFDGCKLLGAPELRALLKKLMGENAELRNEFYEPSTNRDILFRLQNNIKLRQIEGEDYAGALAVVRRMKLIDPNEYRLNFDAGVLLARTGELENAMEALESYIECAPRSKDRHDAALLLQQIKEQLI